MPVSQAENFKLGHYQNNRAEKPDPRCPQTGVSGQGARSTCRDT
jgi:hypothetical protein